jgi:hypothetical protein
MLQAMELGPFFHHAIKTFFAPTLYFMAVKSLGYFLQQKVGLGPPLSQAKKMHSC